MKDKTTHISILKFNFATFLRKWADKLYTIPVEPVPPVTKDSIREDAKKMSPGSVVIFDADEGWKFAFQLFISRRIFSRKEIDKYSKRAERQRRQR